MPIIKSAKKQLKQNKRNRARNFPVRAELKTTVKKALTLVKEGKLAEAQKFLPFAYKIIDMAAKKNIIHPKNAAHKKSRIAQALNELEKKGGKSAPAEAPTAAKAEPEVKETPVKEVAEETKE
ncbi:30S ribosomal protein S20 [Candidatus Peregrinibacteria bacterium]|jgi:small subunit ribosomal protein S20|nr:30S ribosomal protein S20 [Candidatus Peregrinibacteria bacterium]MBT4055794.1 30S ribosomal protein S20 [Candidatus Peregrinibacteria bacterium]